MTKDEFELRGKLATLKCWHRMTQEEVEDLLSFAAAQPEQEPLECLDCGSNNVGIPAAYQSLVDSVKTQTAETSAERTLQYLGYTNCGSEFWKPPLGISPAAQRKPLTDEEITWRKRTIMEMAREVGFDSAPDGHMYHPDTSDPRPLDKFLEAFAALVREEAQAEEREACAKVCDEGIGTRFQGDVYAYAIRARGQA